MEVGFLDDKRNFTHVSDMVKAYWLAIDKCPPGELFLVGSQDDSDIHTFREALEKLISMSLIDNIKYEIVDKYVRPTQVPFLISDVSKFMNLTGWEPQIGFEKILIDTLEYWRNKK